MEAVMPVILLLLKLSIIIVFALVVQGSAGYNIFPPPENFPAISPVVEGTPDPVHHRKSLRSIAPSPASLPNGSFLSSPLVLPPLMSAPVPQMIKGHVPFLSPSTPTIPPYGTAPPPSAFEGHVPSSPPSTPQRKAAPAKTTPASVPLAPVPVATPWRYAPVNKAPMPEPRTLPLSAHQGNAPSSKVLIQEPIAPVSLASPPRESGQSPSAAHPAMPNIRGSKIPVPVASPASEMPQNPPAIHPGMPGESPSILPDPNASPTSNPSPSIIWKRDGMPVAAPPYGMPMPIPPMYHSTDKGAISAVAPSKHKITRHSNGPIAPFLSSPKFPSSKGYHSPASSPSASFHKHRRIRNKIPSPPPASSYPVSSPASKQGPAIPAALLPKYRRRHYAPPPMNPGSLFSPSHFPFPPPVSCVSQAPSPSPIAASAHTIISPLGSSSKNPKLPLPPLVQALPPPPPNEVSPLGSSSKSPKLPLPPLVEALPPPPPNEDCSSTICTEPYTNTPPGSPCGCVWPMQVGLRLSISLYTFFPLVSELAQEIASGAFMKQSQVRIIGANAATQQPEKTIVLIDLVPLGEKFDNTTAFLTYQRFWHKQVAIKAPFFGDYDVLYVHYPGLPSSPPLAPSSITIIDDGPYSGNDSNARTIKPLGVDVPKRQHNHGLNSSVIAIIALSAFVTVVLCSAASWVFLFRRREHVRQTEPTVQALLPSLAKPSGNAGSLIGSGPSSASLSFGSSIATFPGSAKTFSSSDIERATDKFDASRILGEGGFGRVYSGVLEDGTKVAVKVLKRADQHSGREFLAEVEMLSRLHHRNLVKLIGICTEECARCLVYELIPNGSVESHLHGVDKETTPLDWGARIKIALGAARALAYLHEDSSPRVIHRDFKSSNILLEHDFTPKVSDFGLARTAMDDENRHISTRVMGTFGYVAPEYAMTGHLLVKSDVYSYGVVLLELLTGRKPVDMSQLPGQENLVAWARPLLTSTEGLETIIDTSLGPDVPFDSVAKVAAIASMCVQSEVSHRPFMGEVVQALKLVCNECDEAKGTVSRNSSRGDLSIDMDRISTASGQLPDTLQSQYSVPNYNTGLDTARGLSASELFSSSARFGRQDSGSFRMLSSSGPLRTGRGRRFWQRMRRLSGGSVSEHGVMFKLWPGSH